ncbi:MAG TPA: hypothetical protein EYP14_18535, partial [Planctomycetaceae bacterium]|nr:hypothetical protein [Planctomycetaceae bacterium]
MVFGNEHVFNTPLRGAIRLIEITATPPNAPISERRAVQPGSPKTWGAGRLKLTFENRYGALARASFGSTKLIDADEFTPLWQVYLRADRGLGMPLIVGPESAPPVQITNEGTRWRLEWHDIPIPRDEAKLAVCVRVKSGPEPRMAAMQIDVHNPSKRYGIWEVHFPILTLCPLSENVAAHKLLMPMRWGEARPDPFATKLEKPPPSIACRCNYPGAHMQFIALVSPHNGATYLATYDGTARFKETWMQIMPGRKRIMYYVRQFPDDMGEPGSDYAQPYPIVLGHVQGDWFDVCRTYRRWAIRQRWAALGPLSRREDIPQWYKRSSVVLRESLSARNERVGPNLANALRAAKEFPGARMTIWYGWHKVADFASSAVPRRPDGAPSLSAGAGWPWQPKDGVSEALHEMTAAGLFPTAYINTRLYDRTTQPTRNPLATWALPFVIRDVAGEPAFYKRELNLWDMCRWTQGWQARYCQNCEVAMRAGFRGIYLDSFGRSNSLCFASREHGHSRGGGTTCVEGQRRFAKVVRQRIRTIFPEAITTGEAPIEAFIDVLDGKLLHYNLPRNFAPLYTAVYHDYQLCYGRTIGNMRENPEPTFSMLVGRLFVEGVQMGRVFLESSKFFLWSPKYRAQLAYLKRCALAKVVASDYLSLGEFMRPPIIETPLPTVETDYRRVHTVMPIVLLRAWKAPNGTVAHVLTNVGSQPIEIT